MALQRQRLGDYLITQGLLSPEQLDHALAMQKVTGRRLGQVLVDLGLLRPDQVAAILAEQLGVRYWDLELNPPDPAAARLVPARLERRFQLVPVARQEGRLVVAMADPTNVEAQDAVAMLTGLDVEPVLSREEDIQIALARLFGVMESVEEAVRQTRDREGRAPAAQAHPREDGEALRRTGRGPAAPWELHGAAIAEEHLEADAPIVRLVDSILTQAVREGATDVHLEPQEDRLRVRFRVDGLLREATSAPLSLQRAVAARIKVMAGLNVSERRLPQDGRFTFAVDGRQWDVRVATMPTMLGEKVALRLLSKEAGALSLWSLGMDPDTLERFRHLLGLPHGMLLVTGPTGSGKSTTLAAALSYLNSDRRNIVTVEDPIEHRIPGINQIQVNPRAGLTLAVALRHLLRQDPDVVMVGEIRDQETADIAMKAALTGHLVLATLHTNSAPGALVRLVDMGVEPYLVASAVTGVLGQRLIRLLCPDCKEPYLPSPEEAALLGTEPYHDEPLYRAVGCRACHGTGYRGRTGVFELLVMDDGLRALVRSRADEARLGEAAVQDGMVPLIQAGRLRVLEGDTSVEEFLRVLAGEERPGLAPAGRATGGGRDGAGGG